MKINKKSWHYRIVKAYESYEWQIKTNLCGYFWQVVKASLLFTLLFTAVMFWSWNGIYTVFVTPINGFLLGAAIVWWVFVGMILGSSSSAIGSTHWLQTPIRLPKRAQRVKPYKEPSLLRKYMKAQHDKVCPTLDFVVDE